MGTRYFNLVCGLVFTLLGILAFVPGFVSVPISYPSLSVESGFGLLLGSFPVNIILDICFLAVGLWGIYCYRNYTLSRTYGRVMCIVFGVAAIMGMIPGLNTVFGLMPLYGNNIWLMALASVTAGYFGYRKPIDALDGRRNMIQRDMDVRNTNINPSTPRRHHDDINRAG